MKSITEILADYGIRPRPSHPGQYRGKCCFRENHRDNSGRKSLFLSTEQNWYHCFSCGESGTLLDLLTSSKFNMKVFDALDHINTLSFEDNNDTKKEPKHVEYYLPVKPPTYYLDRGFTKEQLRAFKVGYGEVAGANRSREAIHIPLFLGKNLTNIQFLIPKENGDKIIWDLGDFEKDGYFYGNEKIDRDCEELTLVEGFTDLWRTHFRGYDVLGLLGTHFSKKHIDFLTERYPNLFEVVLATDNDKPGFVARELIYRYLKDYYDVSFLIYPRKDPDACSEKDYHKSYENRMDYIPYQIGMAKLLGEEEYEWIVTAAEKIFKKRSYI